MSPATVGLQYSREASRGQVVLLPATATPLGMLVRKFIHLTLCHFYFNLFILFLLIFIIYYYSSLI